MAAIIFGVILLIIGIIAFCMATFSTQKRLDQLVGSGRQKIGEIVEAYKQTKADLGEMAEENTVSEKLTVMGEPSCDEPLISPLGNKPCIYYSMKVTSSRVEHYTEKDSEGRTVNKSRTITDTLDQSTNSTRFKINDGTGTVMVDPQNGQFEGLIKSVDKSETRTANQGASISFGNFSLNLSNSFSPKEPETIKYEEEIIGLDRRLTVIGTLCDKMGEFEITKQGKTPVIVSTKSQDEMIAETKSSLKTQKIVAMVCGGLGLALLILGIILKAVG